MARARRCFATPRGRSRIFEDKDAAADINWLIDVVTGIRSVRSEMNVPAGSRGAAGCCRRARLQKELAKTTEEIARLHKKLSNEKFVANAPEEIVEAEREKLAEYRALQEKLGQALERLRDVR
jgi:valyl-tRNA synthetase